MAQDESTRRGRGRHAPHPHPKSTGGHRATSQGQVSKSRLVQYQDGNRGGQATKASSRNRAQQSWDVEEEEEQMSQNLIHGQRMYDRMKFPQYTYQPYPRWVTNHEGKQVIVQDAKEELAVAAEPKSDAKDAMTKVAKLEAEAQGKDSKIAELERQVAELKSGRATTAASSAAVTKATNRP